MNRLILFQGFECLVVVFETFIVYQYINGLFEKRIAQKRTLLWFAVFCFGLTLLSLFCREELVLFIYTICGVYILTWGLFKASIPSRIISVFYFSATMIGAEIFCSSLMSGLWNVDVSAVLEYGVLRVLGIVVTKLLQIVIIKISVFAVTWKTGHSSRTESKAMIPLLLCQVCSIIIAHCIYIISSSIDGRFEGVTLFSVTGILYINIVVFWYFDRIKATFDYLSRIEAEKLNIELKKQYYTALEEHQHEIDALSHDMKKHISLMKTLMNDGQEKITSAYIHELEVQVDSKTKLIRTAYPVLSALLTEQNQRAKKANISYDLDVRLYSDIRIEPVDLCVILGNLFDNALDACMLIPPEENKYIKVDIVQKNNVMVVQIENSYCSMVETRVRSGRHGFGLKNVRQSISKYDGKIKIIEENNVFRVSVLFP